MGNQVACMRPGSKKEDKIGKIDLERKGQKKERDIFEANTVIEQKENLKASIKKENENEELHHAKTHEHAHEEKKGHETSQEHVHEQTTEHREEEKLEKHNEQPLLEAAEEVVAEAVGF